jgi:hypothetical protein
MCKKLFYISNSNFLSRLRSQIRVKDYRNLKLSESEDLGYIEINETIRKKTTFLVPSFPFVKEDKDKDKKPAKATHVIEFLLKREPTVYTAST